MDSKFLFLVAVLAISGLFFAATQVKCVDSDGNNVYSKGKISVTFSDGKTYDYVDFCTADKIADYANKPDYISEYLCSGNTGYATPALCPSGYTCKDGACVQKEQAQQPVSLTVQVKDKSANPVNGASVALYYADPDDGWSDLTATTGASGYASLSVTSDRQFILKAFVYTPYQAYGKLNGYCGEGLAQVIKTNADGTHKVCNSDLSSCSNTLQLILYPNNCGAQTSQASCSDSDNGADVYSKGTTSGTDAQGTAFSKTDYCSGSTGVVEFSCNGTAWQSKYYVCPSGYECKDAACVQKEQPANSCTDLDGADYYTPSKIVYTDSQATNKTLADICLSEAKLMERTCTGTSPSYVEFTCPQGYKCENGACVSTQLIQTKCVDSDGNNVYSKGKISVTFSDGKTYDYTDFCSGDYIQSYAGKPDYISEYLCSGNTGYATPALCPSGYTCSDGACVQKPATVANETTVAVRVREYQDSLTGGVKDANVLLYYQDPDDGWSDGSQYTDSDGNAKMAIALNRPFILKAFVYTPYQAYGKLNGYCGEGTVKFILNQDASGNYQVCKYGTTDCSPVLRLVLYKNNCQQQSTKTCTETDGGNNKYVKGKNTIQTSDGAVVASSSDYCRNVNTVAEITCNGDQWNVTYENCGSGYVCSDGSCVQTNNTATCTETDGGNNIYVAGVASGYYNGNYISEAKDFCSSQTQVVEYYCSGNVLKVNNPSGEFCPQDYVCVAGACIKNEETPPMPPEETNMEFTVELKKGWQMISTPVDFGGYYTYAKIVDTDCAADDTKVYVYMPSSKTYFKQSPITDGGYLLSKFGYWVKKKTNGTCTVKLSASSKVALDNKYLFKGWNQIGAPYSSTEFEKLKGSCNLASGPWEYVLESNSWKKATTLEPGIGYFVKVDADCMLGSPEDVPPALPVS